MKSMVWPMAWRPRFWKRGSRLRVYGVNGQNIESLVLKIESVSEDERGFKIAFHIDKKD